MSYRAKKKYLLHKVPIGLIKAEEPYKFLVVPAPQPWVKSLIKLLFVCAFPTLFVINTQQSSYKMLLCCINVIICIYILTFFDVG